jgi:large subunit ribosomal protein L22
MVRAQATAKYIRTSAQKAGLVLDLIRGKDVNKALTALQFSNKSVARDIAKVLRSAVANVQQKEGFGGDVERLFVSKAHADNGPSMKRVRPAPMGRAFRIVKRTTHLTVEVTEKPQVIKAIDAADAAAPAKKPRGAAKTAKTAKTSKTAKRSKAAKAAKA